MNESERSGEVMRLDQFSGQSFEQLVQALAASLFGAGVTIFGPGRDGGREATYRGKLPTFEPMGWDGYTVIQAKCKERMSADNRDASWLATQLRSELQKFEDNDELERPDFYLLCSNVQLSAVPKVGGKATVDKVFEEFAPKIGLKGWHVWSADEIISLLENFPGVRQTYASWVTPGDVLTSLLAKLIGHDLKSSVPLILSQELRTDRDARLRDAGQETEQAVYLEEVFIDLPVDLPAEFSFTEAIFSEDSASELELEVGEIEQDDGARSFKDFGFDEVDTEQPTDNCVASIFKLSSDRLDPKSVSEIRINKRAPLRNRVVILGGPGQGKSTLGQFVVQLARARLLAACPTLTLNPETVSAIGRIQRAAENLQIPINGPARLPIRVDLPLFADAVSRGAEAGKSILGFVSEKFAAISGESVTVQIVRKLISEIPSIVVFDGLDEVPPSANRQAVLQAIETFWDDIYSVGGDVLSIVTSRPQGYDNDLSPHLWQHWSLMPLQPKYALSYAEKLGNIRVSEEDRKKAILSDIDKACSDPATALLTTSPLQVTILFGISLLKGSIPQDRWELFDRYYALLREREAQKPGETSKFIRDNRRTIDELHQTCGWVLQSEAETPGRTVSFLTDDQFKAIIRQILLVEGHEGEQLQGLVGRLAKIATDRLVLLASRVEGEVSFDVRSLQEYMAAAKLVSSDQAILTARLRRIAVSAHWRHVFRIAASKIFSIAEMGHLRNDVVAIIDAMDKGDLDKNAEFVKAGAVLALDLLADGVASNAPRFYRTLMTRAVTLLDLERDAFDVRLTKVVDAEKSDVLFEAIESRLAGQQIEAVRNSIFCLTELQSSSRAKDLLDRFLLSDPAVILRSLARLEPMSLTKSQRDQLKNVQLKAGELSALTFVRSVASNHRDISQSVSEWVLLPDLQRYHRIRPSVGIPVTVVKNIMTHVVPLDVLGRYYFPSADIIGPNHDNWPVFNEAIKFLRDPTPDSLASCGKEIFYKHRGVEERSSLELPWPLHHLLLDLKEAQDPEKTLELAQSGQFGDRPAWLEAELRWRDRTLTVDDFLSWSDGNFLSPQIATVGAPALYNVLPFEERPGLGVLSLVNIINQLKSVSKREYLLWIAVISQSRPPVFNEGGISEILSVYFQDGIEAIPLTRRRGGVFMLPSLTWTDPRIPELAHKFGMSGRRVGARLPDVVAALVERPELRGLLAHVRGAFGMSRSTIPENIPNEVFEVSDSDPLDVRAGAILLRLRTGNVNGLELDVAAKWLAECSNSVLSEVARLLQTSTEPVGAIRERFAFEVARQLRLVGKEPRGRLRDLLNKNMSAKSTGLLNDNVSIELKLPCLSRF